MPVFGVNFGEMGFLATVDRDAAREGFVRALAGDFEVLSLPAIEVSGARGRCWRSTTSRCIASRASGSPTSSTRSAPTRWGRVRCDGLVVATPAGSTGYNLANGGPVMAWGVHGYVVSFIAPHSFTARTLVVAPDDEVAVDNRSREESVDVTVDGRPSCTLGAGERLRTRFVVDRGTLAQIPGTNLLPAAAREVRTAGDAVVVGLRRPRWANACSVRGGGYNLGVLHELRVENLLLMERAQLRLGPGLNALTGETGAGKTLLAHALDLLLGGRARRGIVRPGAPEAYVEGVFDLPPELAGAQRIPEGAQELVLARRVWPDGRTRAYVCGRAATQADLQELGGRLLSFYGQHEHRRLMLSTAQLELLDAYCDSGTDVPPRLRGRLRDAHDRVRGLEDRAAQLRELAGARDRELDLLRFELDEIEAAAPAEGEQQSLVAERDRLRHQEDLARAAAFGAESLVPEAGGGAAELLAGAATQLEAAAGMDAELAPLAERLGALQYEVADVGAELRGYLLGLEGDRSAADQPARLQEVEDRLALLARLERKHGGTLGDVLAHAARCRARRAELQDVESDLETVQDELAGARSDRDALAATLTRRGLGQRPGWPGRCAGAWPSWRWPMPASRSR